MVQIQSTALKHILIVDDQKFVRLALTKELEENPDYIVEDAENGKKSYP